MRIFLSHRSRDKALVREFKSFLPSFLNTWLDEDSLTWGEFFPAALKSSIQSGVDFLVIFLDNDSLKSAWVKQELEWALERERELKRTFVLPILLEEVDQDNLPPGFTNRLFLKLSDYTRASVESLADKATLQLFQLVVESFSGLQLEVPQVESLNSKRDYLSAGQARLLGYLVEKAKESSEIKQRKIEKAMEHSTASAELYYRLEALIAQGFLKKRRIPEDGQFSYQLSENFVKDLEKM